MGNCADVVFCLLITDEGGHGLWRLRLVERLCAAHGEPIDDPSGNRTSGGTAANVTPRVWTMADPANATAPIVAPQPATRFNPKFVDDKAGWSPYWNASFVSSTDSTDSKDDESDASDAESGLLADANPMKTSDKLFKKVLHGRESAQIKDIKASDDDQRNDQHND